MTYAEMLLKIRNTTPADDRFQPTIYSDGFFGVVDTKLVTDEDPADVALCDTLDEAIETAYGMSRCPERCANEWDWTSLRGYINR